MIKKLGCGVNFGNLKFRFGGNFSANFELLVSIFCLNWIQCEDLIGKLIIEKLRL
jgi:hypothetical protein